MYEAIESEWHNIESAISWLYNKIKSAKKKRKDSESELFIKQFKELVNALEAFLLKAGHWDTRKELGAKLYNVCILETETKHSDEAGYAAYYVAWICQPPKFSTNHK
jgi:hypothetical protein